MQTHEDTNEFCGCSLIACQVELGCMIRRTLSRTLFFSVSVSDVSPEPVYVSTSLLYFFKFFFQKLYFYSKILGDFVYKQKCSMESRVLKKVPPEHWLPIHNRLRHTVLQGLGRSYPLFLRYNLQIKDQFI